MFKLPVEMIDPVVKSDPVNTNVSAFEDNNVVPLSPIIFVDPVTVKEPDITTFWFSLLTEDAVDENEAEIAFNTYDDVFAFDAVKAWVAYDEVPNSEPVNEEALTNVVTFSEFRLASDPDTISFFQFGIS